MRPNRPAFTLVEILVVVIILGILSAVVVPQFSKATQQAAEVSTVDQLVKIREAIAVYHAQNNSAFPSIDEGFGSWAQLREQGFFHMAPVNNWVGGDNPNSTRIVIGSGPDGGFHTDYGWIFDPTTGDVWAGGFDADDRPWPK